LFEQTFIQLPVLLLSVYETPKQVAVLFRISTMARWWVHSYSLSV